MPGWAFVPLACAAAMFGPALAFAAPPVGYLDAVDCEEARGWTQDPDVPELSIDVHLYYDGPAGSGIGVPRTADIHRQDLCGALGSCNHAYSAPIPRSLMDGASHPVHAYGIDSGGVGPNPQLSASPKSFTCPPPAIPEGVVRELDGPAMEAWGFSTFWSAVPVTADYLSAQPTGKPPSPEITLVRSGEGPTVWLLDRGLRRRVADELVAQNWGLNLENAEVWTGPALAQVPEGTDLWTEPFLISDGTKSALVDDAQCDPQTDPECAPGEGGEGGEEGADDDGGLDTGGEDGMGEESGSESGGTQETGGESGTPSSGGLDSDRSAAGCQCAATGDSAPLGLFFTGLALLGLGNARRKR